MNQIVIRKLSENDIDELLKTINDKEITKYFKFYGHVFIYEEIHNFVINSFDSNNRHFAISDEMNNYLGTISLKNIDFISKTAEYAIMLAQSSIGMGVAKTATDLILQYAFDSLDINKVYFNVASVNRRAINFYIKYGFIYEGKFIKHIFIRGQYYDLEWYSIFRKDFKNLKRSSI